MPTKFEITSNNCLDQLQAMKPLGLYKELEGLSQTKGFLIAYKYKATITSTEFKYCSIMMELGPRLDKSLNFLGELKNLTYLTLYSSCDFNLATLDLQRLCPNLKGINYDSHVLIPDKMIKEHIPLHYTRYLTNLLSKQVANLEMVISKAYIFDWINEIGLTNAFEFALAVGAIEDFNINFALDRKHDQQSREYDSENGLSRLESFFILVLAFRGLKKNGVVLLSRMLQLVRSTKNSDPDTGVFCMHSLDNTTVRCVFNMIDTFRVSILGGLDRSLAFKFMEFVIAECLNVSSFEYVDVHRSVEIQCIMEEYDLSKPDDDTATSIIQKRMNSLSIETAILDDIELGQISQYFPCIVKILCNNSFTDCVKLNEIEIDVTSFKHLKSLTYFIQSSQKGQYYAFVQCIHTNGDKVYHHLDKKTPATINPCTSRFFEDCVNNHKPDIYITTIYCRSDVEILLKLSQ
ncbi:uncharacterized protein EV154DRAFT_600178 [Mucor mucedo]|uniref:uncharacterized protein n=1 Tax=Mucor mucedo TaxID=29922 RepID=UPI002220F536|nr:uncharacterized protein EV154DRAFT_600178 [Mucor mucedo]KAI7894304.1 hypothetical protein EV154DRAFT_600178 [Mucor mucedo]